jgi:hypothetical protein
VKTNNVNVRYMYLHPIWLDKHEDIMISALGFFEIHQHTGPFFSAADVQFLSLSGSDDIRILMFHQEFKASVLFPLPMFCKYMVSSLNLS